MKRQYFPILIAFLFAYTFSINGVLAQGMKNSGAKINITAGAYLNIDNGGFSNETGGAVTNAGTMLVEGTWENYDNAGVFTTSPTAGLVVLDGATQNIEGDEETHFFNLTVDGSDVKTLAGTGNATGATVHGTITLDDQSLVLNEKVLTVENSVNSAITSVSDGFVVSETGGPSGNYSRVRWNIGTTVSSYTIPFGTSPSAPNPLESIPFTFNVQTAGTPASPYRTFATYATDDANTFGTYAPEYVAHLTDDFGTANGNSVIDRFWVIDEENTGVGVDGIAGNLDDPDYSVKPEIRYTFTYADADLTGNTITPSQITPQRYNHDEDRWLDWMYSDPQFTNNPGGNSLTMTIGADAGTWGEDMYPVWTLVDNSDPLPIELVRFVAQCDEEGIVINWSTWTETNNDFFTLERSLNGVDFVKVDIIEGAGNSNQPISYEVVDYNAYSGTSYYRLKDTDTFGKEGYSNVIAVTCGDGSNDFQLVNAYDVNNTDIVVEFTGSENEKYNIMLYDASGRRALDFGGTAVNGMNKVRLPAGDLARGIYIINLNNNIKNYSKRVMLH